MGVHKGWQEGAYASIPMGSNKKFCKNRNTESWHLHESFFVFCDFLKNGSYELFKSLFFPRVAEFIYIEGDNKRIRFFCESIVID